MRRRALPALLGAALLPLGGCAMSEARAPAAPQAEEAPMAPVAVMAERDEGSRSADKKDSGGFDMRLAQNAPAPARPAPGGAPPPPPPPADGSPRRDAGGEVAQIRAPMLIYTAHVTMAAFEVAPGLAKVETLARELGGFLAKRDDRSVTIRVPAGRFDEAVRAIETYGDVLHRNVSAEDVTEQFRDLEVRLGTARSVRQRLTELLARATKVEESIAIEKELERVVGEIERLEGKMKFLRDRAAFSTITVSFEPKPKEQVGGGQVRLPVPWLHNLGLRRLLSL